MKYHEETMEAMRQKKELEEQIEKAMRSVGISHLTEDEEKEFKSQVRLGLGTYATDVEVMETVEDIAGIWKDDHNQEVATILWRVLTARRLNTTV
jgi:glutamate synthase domain-containing protein 2